MSKVGAGRKALALLVAGLLIVGGCQAGTDRTAWSLWSALHGPSPAPTVTVRPLASPSTTAWATSPRITPSPTSRPSSSMMPMATCAAKDSELALEEAAAERWRSLRSGSGRWYVRTDVAPNTTERWSYRYSVSGELPEGQWAEAPGSVSRYLYESALSFRRPYLNPDLPLYGQETHLSCEAASLRMVLASCGITVSEEEIRALIPLSNNPHEGFVGEYQAPSGGIENYGVYAEPLVGVLAHYGLEARVSYGMSYSELDRLIREGARVIVWLTKWDAGEREEGVVKENGRVVAKLHGHQHAAVVAGRDVAWRWILYDPYPEGGLVPGESSEGQVFRCSVIPNWEAFGNPSDPAAWGRMALVAECPKTHSTTHSDGLRP